MNVFVPTRAAGALPPPAPLAMPEQEFTTGQLQPHPLGSVTHRWRWAVLGGAGSLTLGATAAVVQGLARDGFGGLDAGFTCVFAVLFALVALSCTSAFAGLGRPATAAPPTPLRSRVALLFPVYNEEASRVLGTMEAMREALDDAKLGPYFDLFLLSDSTEPETRRREAAGVARLQSLHPGSVYYRLRRDNAGRKAGNIAEWVRSFGADYPCFVILDADSMMEAATLHHLAAAMEADPRAGLIQTLPTLTGGRTLFARMQQFASALHGPVIARGLAAWHGEAGNYWGHNAILRTCAFAEAAGLPALHGRKPFSGPILSHDFVEAALLRRAGWGVHLRADLTGSHEQGPPTLEEAAARDRRWCQGNLQHAALLGAAGLHPLSRLHLLGGILAYLASPLWLILLALGTAQALHGEVPATPWMLGLVLLLLLAPKLLALFARPRAWRGMVGEVALTTLLAPIGMVTQTMQILDILRGRDSGWKAQTRESGTAGAWAQLRRYRLHTLTGALLLAPVLVQPALLPWLLPVALGLLGAPALAWLLAQPSTWRGFTTASEARPSRLLRRAVTLRRAWQLDLCEDDALPRAAWIRPSKNLVS